MEQTSYPWFTGNPDEFKFIEHEIEGDKVVLIIPNEEKAVAKPWNDRDKIYRSSVWRVKDGYPVSLGYKKFVNYGEQPNFEPVAPNTKFELIEKIDGTCLICSKYKKTYIFRTRGSMDAHNMTNGHELDELIYKYNIKEALDRNPGFTFLFEWVSPENRLCVSYAEPDLYCTGIVRHSNYQYLSQGDVDRFAKSYLWRRPNRVLDSEIYTSGADKAAEFIKNNLTRMEGYVACFGVVYIVLKKMKTMWHLKMHMARQLLGNKKKLVAALYDFGCFNDPNEQYDLFCQRTSSNMEYEVIEYYGDQFEQIWQAWILFQNRCEEARDFLKDNNCTDPHQIADLIKEGKWKHNTKYLWNEFRNKNPERNFIIEEILNELN